MTKLLYLGIKHEYINPTSNLLIKIYKNSADTLFIGPGFQNTMDLFVNNEIENVIDNFIPEVVLIDGRIFGFEFLKINISGQKYSKKNIDKFIFFIKNFISHNKIPLIIDLTYLDTYKLSITLIEKLNKYNCYVVGLDKNFFLRKEDYKYLLNEKFAKYATNSWYDYAKNNSHLIISFPHPIDETEFFYEKIYQRKIDLSIMGVKYFCRKKAGEILKKSKHKIYSSDLKRKSISFVISSLRKFSINTNRLNGYFNSYFRSKLVNSKISYTCGSGVDFPVRKFLEIPASGALLMCQKFKNFENFGFKHGKNAIAVEHDELEDAVNYYLNNLDLSQKIINNCQKFLLENHSTKSRIKQMSKTLQLIVQNKFKGSSWKKGSFFLN
jgi:hypothetical protein